MNTTTAPRTLPNDFKRRVFGGRIAATPGASAAFDNNLEMIAILTAYTGGDWGELDAHDQKVNESALQNFGRVMGAYDVHGERVWVITDPEWHTTTFLLPEEY